MSRSSLPLEIFFSMINTEDAKLKIEIQDTTIKFILYKLRLEGNGGEKS